MPTIEQRITLAREALGSYDETTLKGGIWELMADLAHLLESDCGSGGQIADIAYSALLHFEHECAEGSE